MGAWTQAEFFWRQHRKLRLWCQADGPYQLGDPGKSVAIFGPQFSICNMGMVLLRADDDGSDDSDDGDDTEDDDEDVINYDGCFVWVKFYGRCKT